MNEISNNDNKSEKSPTVSVLMSVYNEPLDWIKKSIDSIIAQTFSDFEFIIVNDKPDRPELSEFLNNIVYKDTRIIVKTNPQNMGLTKSLNVGLKLCRGKYIARMDADDFSHKQRFELQVNYLDNNPDTIVCGTKIKEFGKTSFKSYNCFFENDIDIRGQMLLNSGLAHPSVMIRSEILKNRNIFYDESYRTAQDFRLWEQLFDFGLFHNIPQELLYYRVSSNQISSSKSEDQQRNRRYICQRIHDKLFLPSGKGNGNIDKNNKKDILHSYELRKTLYEKPSILNLYLFIKNNNTVCSSKEIAFLIARTIFSYFKKRY